jgi:putative MATE family efflux protein
MNAPVARIARLTGPEARGAGPRVEEMSPRTRLLLTGPIASTLIRLAWPNVLVMLAQASTGLIETWWVSHLGPDALTGMAVVFPGYLMMTMLSAGAFGGGISSAIARALGAGRRSDADALVLHAVLVNLVLGVATSALFLLFGRRIYAAMGGSGGSLDAAMSYSNVVFWGNTILWVTNAFASIIRGTGVMLFPSMVVCVGVALLIPLSPLLIFGFGPLPGLGIAGGGVAVVVTTTLMGVILCWYVLSGNAVVRFRLSRLRAAFFGDILRVGAVGSVNSLQSTLTLALTTGLVGAAAGPGAVAGYGTGSRLEYLLIPLVFGLGAPLVALVGANIGAGQNERALRITLVGAAMAFGATEAIGLAAALWPSAWLTLFGQDPLMIATGSAYLRLVGPAYGFFGLGLALYFASQGAGKLLWPLIGGFARLVIAVGGGWLALNATGSLTAVFGLLSLALAVYGVIVGVAVKSGVWFRAKREAAEEGAESSLSRLTPRPAP